MYVLNRQAYNEPSSVFTGDHLFLAGCGKFMTKLVRVGGHLINFTY